MALSLRFIPQPAACSPPKVACQPDNKRLGEVSVSVCIGSAMAGEEDIKPNTADMASGAIAK